MSSSDEEQSKVPPLKSAESISLSTSCYTKDLKSEYFPDMNAVGVQFKKSEESQMDFSLPKPYNVWKSESQQTKAFLPRSHENFDMAMVSNLGQNLENVNAYVPYETKVDRGYQKQIPHYNEQRYDERIHTYEPYERHSPSYKERPPYYGNGHVMERNYPPSFQRYQDYGYCETPQYRPEYVKWRSPKERMSCEQKAYLNHSCPCARPETKKSEKSKNKQICDLFRIVWLQNEQLASLQKQVKKLIELTTKNEEKPDQETKRTPVSKKELRTFNLSVIEENKNISEKVSVGIMTSLIENGFSNEEAKSKKKKESHSTEESDNSSDEEPPPIVMAKQRIKNKSKREDDWTLQGIMIPSIAENPPSPEASFHLEMQDYKSESSSETSSSSESYQSEENVQVGWTFYDQVVGKVKNMLETSEGKRSTDDAIRNATMEQLRNLGISFIEPAPKRFYIIFYNLIPNVPRVTFNQKLIGKDETGVQVRLQADSDTSLRMNALASKYLEQNHTAVKQVVTGDHLNGSTNLSVATMRYLERYHLLPNKGESNEKKSKKKKPAGKAKKYDTGKILDITAIKQQPKLLPKTM